MFEAREVIDGGFLELVRYGIRRPDDPLIVDSLKVVIDHVASRSRLPYGPCWRRYNHDGYGQKKPMAVRTDGWGQGRAWPLLGGERAHFELAAGHDVSTPYITAFERFSSVGGMLPEQVWDYGPTCRRRACTCGQSAGSAQPLVWAHAEYIKLLKSRQRRSGLRPYLASSRSATRSARKRTFTRARSRSSASPVR